LNTFKLWAYTDLTGCRMGTFELISGDDFLMDDYETLGNVTSGSEQTFTGKNCNVLTNERLGWYADTGNIEYNNSGYAGIHRLIGNNFNTATNTYTFLSGDSISIYATGIG